MWKRPVRALIRRGLRVGRLRAVVETELRVARRPVRARTDGLPDVFVDGHGVRHPLDPALRDALKPAWRTMLDPLTAAQPPSDEALAGRATKARRSVREAAAIVAASTGVELGGRILEIGCYDGAVAFQLTRLPAAEVVASDLARYYVVQRPGEPAETDIRPQQATLATLRARARAAAGAGTGVVDFIEDDITASGLEPGTFDAIVSFEVLEHVASPQAAFGAMARLLKPGGIGYHDYNPFFSLIGGHSLCTLDFAWGHIRLDRVDVERYVRELRPDHLAQTMRFFDESLNRMTLVDLRSAIEGAGLELCSLLPWTDRALVGRFEPAVLSEVQRSYPTATAEDLLASFVSVVVRRPA